jgi:hypothetical protein
VPVEGDDRYKFGTLVFFNNLGHIGIVYDDSGFYHASSSQGVTFSRFDGYWGKRIVGFRRMFFRISFSARASNDETRSGLMFLDLPNNRHFFNRHVSDSLVFIAQIQ